MWRPRNEIDVILPDAGDFIFVARHRREIKKANGALVLPQPDEVLAVAENKLESDSGAKVKKIIHL